MLGGVTRQRPQSGFIYLCVVDFRARLADEMVVALCKETPVCPHISRRRPLPVFCTWASVTVSAEVTWSLMM